MSKLSQTNAPTTEFIQSLRKVTAILEHVSTSLLSAAVRLAEAGQDGEAIGLVDLVNEIQDAEGRIHLHLKEARTGMIVRLNTH